MSMLTPPGMGGKYRITGKRHPRLRRPRRRNRYVVVSGATFVALSLTAWGALELVDAFSGGTSNAVAGTPRQSHGGGDRDCTTDAKEGHASQPGASQHPKGGEDGKEGKAGDGSGKAGKVAKGASATADPATGLPKPGAVTVNVLNATDHAGLAKSTSKALKKRGFKVGKVANAPAELNKKVKNEGLLRGGTGKQSTDRLKVLGTQLKGADRRYDERNSDDVDLVLGARFKKLDKEKDAAAALTSLGEPAAASASPSATGCRH